MSERACYLFTISRFFSRFFSLLALYFFVFSVLSLSTQIMLSLYSAEMPARWQSILLSLLYFVAAVASQTFAPSNNTLPANMTTPDIELTLTSSTEYILTHNVYNIAPLTSLAGQGQDPNSLNVCHIIFGLCLILKKLLI